MASFIHVRAANLQEFDRRVDGWDGTLYSGRVPELYTSYGSSIFLFPIPSESTTDGLKVLYSRKPTDVVTGSDELDLPLEYHNAVVMYCMGQAQEMDEDYEASTISKAEFEGDIARSNLRQANSSQDTYPLITVMPDDGW
jgi:hypothetical protein